MLKWLLPAVAAALATPPRIPADATAALAALPRERLERDLQHLTAPRLRALENDLGLAADVAAPLLATCVLRRLCHAVLDKRRTWGDVGAALEQHGLGDAIDELRRRAGGSREALWALLMEHEMTAYVPMQCQRCGHRVPDETSPGSTDAEVGISEDAPTDAEAPLVCGGWYRGPRGLVVRLSSRSRVVIWRGVSQ